MRRCEKAGNCPSFFEGMRNCDFDVEMLKGAAMEKGEGQGSGIHEELGYFFVIVGLDGISMGCLQLDEFWPIFCVGEGLGGNSVYRE